MDGAVVHLQKALAAPKAAPVTSDWVALTRRDYLAGTTKWVHTQELFGIIGQSGVASILSLLTPPADPATERPNVVILPYLKQKEARRRVRV